MNNEEKYIDGDFIKGMIEMLTSVDKESNFLAIGIYDSLLDNKNNLDDFMVEFEKLNESQKAKTLWSIYTNHSNPLEAARLNQKYIQLCLEHTKWKMNIDNNNNIQIHEHDE